MLFIDKEAYRRLVIVLQKTTTVYLKQFLLNFLLFYLEKDLYFFTYVNIS